MQIQTWTWGRASDICLVEGHVPIRGWADNTVEGEAPPGTECLRCGAVLERTEEIGER